MHLLRPHLVGAREAEVADLQIAVGIEEEVGWLEVAVQHICLIVVGSGARSEAQGWVRIESAVILFSDEGLKLGAFNL